MSDVREADGLTWRRVHKATPFIRGWIVVVAVLLGMGQNFPQDMLEGGIEPRDVLIPLGIAFGAALLWVGYGWLAWRRMRYAWSDQALYVKSGVLFRQERKVRLDRIQTIHITRPLLARFVGLSELDIASAAGGETNVKLGFLTENDAIQVREMLLDHIDEVTDDPQTTRSPLPPDHAEEPVDSTGQPLTAHSDANGPDGHVPTDQDADGYEDSADREAVTEPAPRRAVNHAPERVIYEIPAPRIVASALLSVAAFLTIITIIVMVTAFAFGNSAIAFSLLPFLFGFGPFVWQRLVSEYGFTAAVAHDGLRVRKGLLETTAQTIPTGRVQALRLSQSLLWRRFGWWRATVNVAGQFSLQDMGKDKSTILPVGSRVEAMDALWLVLPDLGTEDPIALVDAALTGSGTDLGFITSPRSARWLDPWSYRRNGYVLTDRAIIARSGFFNRVIEVVPHERTQSLAVKQGPLQRRLGLASVELHSTPGEIVPSVGHLTEHDAQRLLEEQAIRSREARARADQVAAS
ncbi:PH domain-containing protein [Jonesia quinghaiensis]|uniref:PH domain-containing protein n=1 Tax=Jonesia quinghaiensis TaxID=262806 RepID=UPI0003FFE7B0|nr:PH domain-containing protein [Jonesia quinghaiensis]